MKITLILSNDELKHTELDEYDLAESVKDLIGSGIYFSEISVDVLVNDAAKPIFTPQIVTKTVTN